MKNIYIVGGTMGVGKTTVCQVLKNKLPNSVFLDGDWCWDAHPFQVTEETKEMVQENISYLLNNFIHCSAYENIIFCWVMHDQNIIDHLLKGLDTKDCKIKVFSLICSENALRERLEKDVMKGIRTVDVIERSIARLPLYKELNTMKIDTTNKSVETIVRELASSLDG